MIIPSFPSQDQETTHRRRCPVRNGTVRYMNAPKHGHTKPPFPPRHRPSHPLPPSPLNPLQRRVVPLRLLQQRLEHLPSHQVRRMPRFRSMPRMFLRRSLHPPPLLRPRLSSRRQSFLPRIHTRLGRRRRNAPFRGRRALRPWQLGKSG